MNKPTLDPLFLELEHLERQEEITGEFDLRRRDFFKILGGGILVLSLWDRTASSAELSQSRRFAAGKREPPEIGAWIHIGDTGLATVYVGKAEMGQNIRTSLAQVVAEELPVPFDSIQLVMGDTDLTPYDAGTFGSRTTPFTAPILRKAAATLREILLDLAAEKWKADRSELETQDGKILNRKSRESLSFGQLTEGREILKIIRDDITTISPSAWKIAGTSVPKVDGRSFVTGKHRYSSDMKLPGMLYGKVLRPSAFGAELVSMDSREAETIPGVTVVRDGDFIGLTAPDEYTAIDALRKIKAEWKTSPQPSEKTLFDDLKKNASTRGRNDAFQAGSIEDGMARATQRLAQTYTIAYIAHAPLEPRAALAHWQDGKLTVWTGTQRPFGVQEELQRAFELPEERVRVIMPDCGSGYGGKHSGECAVEAARLARAVQKPVKLVWTREEEFTWAYFRPAGTIDIKSGVTQDGMVTAWEFHNYNSGAAGIQSKYTIPNQYIEYHPSQSPLRQGSYRCLAATANHFARETHMDELAHAVGMDPLEFRLKNIQDERFRDVLIAAAERFGWKDVKNTPERGFGLAGGFEKQSYVAACIEIAIDRKEGGVKVVRVVEAFDCGPAINPDHLRNQIEGMILMGIGGALFEAIHFEEGKILNPRFSRYRVPRFQDTPSIETLLMDRKDIPPAGGGETPIVVIAPAIGNAIFNATGIRLRSMPLIPHGLKF